MRSFKIAGCLLAALAVMAVAASAATASGPAWFSCIKAPKVGKSHTGNFNDKMCTSPNGEGKGKFLLAEGTGRGKRFKGKGGPAVLHAKTWLGDNKIECAQSKASGVAEAPNRESDVEVTFKKCVASIGSKKCNSAGKKPGEVRLHAMNGELGYLKESPAVVGIRLELESEPGGVIAEFTCGEDLEVTIAGSLIGVMEKIVNVNVTKESEIVFATGEYLGTLEYEGKEFAPLVNPVGFESELESIGKGEAPPHVLEATFCGALIEMLVGPHCTPATPVGLDQAVHNKSELRSIKA